MSEAKRRKQQPSSPKASGSKEEGYVVEKVLRKRSVAGDLQYYVKWKGFSASDGTWKSHCDLSCRHLIKQFEQDERILMKLPVVESDGPMSVIMGDRRHRKSCRKDIKKEPIEDEDSSSSSDGDVQDDVFEISSDTESSSGAGRGFSRGLEVDEITGRGYAADGDLFEIKWKETGEKEWIPENEVRKNIPDILEKFLEEELLKPVESA